MKTSIFAVLAVALAFANGALAQEKVPVYAHSKGQIFSARLEIHEVGKEPKEWVFHPHLDSQYHKIGELDVGKEYKIRSGHSRLGWPQTAVYVTMEAGNEATRSEATYEPILMKLKEGQTLRIEFPRSYEPYDGKYFALRGVNMALILPRPYWYQDVAPGLFKGKELYPNSLCFMVDDEWGWGEKTALGRLAQYAAGEIKKGKPGSGDYRVECHLSLVIQLGADGKHLAALTAMSEDDLRKELQQQLEITWEQMKKFKCYRPFDGQSGAPVAALKKAGFLPDNWPANRTYISLAEGLELARPIAKKWRADYPERAPKK